MKTAKFLNLAFSRIKIKEKFKNSAQCLIRNVVPFYTLRFIHQPLPTIMKKTPALIILLFASILSYAQTEKVSDKNISGKFEEFFNSSDYNGIFELFSDDMKNALPKEQANQFFVGLKTQAGKINARDFTKYVRGSFASYKTTFENGVFAVNISTDNQLKIKLGGYFWHFFAGLWVYLLLFLFFLYLRQY